MSFIDRLETTAGQLGHLSSTSVQVKRLNTAAPAYSTLNAAMNTTKRAKSLVSEHQNSSPIWVMTYQPAKKP